VDGATNLEQIKTDDDVVIVGVNVVVGVDVVWFSLHCIIIYAFWLGLHYSIIFIKDENKFECYESFVFALLLDVTML